MNTQENNRLIAEFMEYPELGTEGDFSYLKYHKKWYWLMPVVDKIEREHKANFIIKCTWNEFNEHSIHQVIVNIEQGEMSKDKSCIYDSKKIYDYVGDAVKDKREATYKAVVEFIKQYNNQ